MSRSGINLDLTCSLLPLYEEYTKASDSDDFKESRRVVQKIEDLKSQFKLHPYFLSEKAIYESSVAAGSIVRELTEVENA